MQNMNLHEYVSSMTGVLAGPGWTAVFVEFMRHPRRGVLHG
jgi:hypothetical protein